MKYLVRHTIDEKWENLKDMKFDEFLFEVGMFESSVKYDIIRDEDRKKQNYDISGQFHQEFREVRQLC